MQVFGYSIFKALWWLVEQVNISWYEPTSYHTTTRLLWQQVRCSESNNIILFFALEYESVYFIWMMYIFAIWCPKLWECVCVNFKFFAINSYELVEFMLYSACWILCILFGALILILLMAEVRKTGDKNNLNILGEFTWIHGVFVTIITEVCQC